MRVEILQPNVQHQLGCVGAAIAARHAWLRAGHVVLFDSLPSELMSPEKQKNFKAYDQALAISFQAKKNLGQFDFSVGGKSQFCDSDRKKCKICPKVPQNGTKTLRLHILS